MNFIKLFCIFFGFLFISNSIAANKMLHYEPEVVELIGTVRIMDFPGRPNYSSIADGDGIERGPYLKLDQQIDVDTLSGYPSIGDNVLEKNVKLVQIIDGNQDNWNKLKEGCRVHITGTLFHQIIAHHHTKVLILVKNLEIYR